MWVKILLAVFDPYMHTYIATKKKLAKNGVLFVLAFTSGFACINH